MSIRSLTVIVVSGNTKKKKKTERTTVSYGPYGYLKEDVNYINIIFIESVCCGENSRRVVMPDKRKRRITIGYFMCLYIDTIFSFFVVNRTEFI